MDNIKNKTKLKDAAKKLQQVENINFTYFFLYFTYVSYLNASKVRKPLMKTEEFSLVIQIINFYETLFLWVIKGHKMSSSKCTASYHV